MHTKQLLNIDKQKIEKAASVIQSLIQGLHPETGLPLTEDSVFQDARVLRSLLTVEECLKAVRGRVERRSQLPKNVGRAWSDEEDARLKSAFHDCKAVEDIAEDHQRTPVAIESRLEKLGLITAENRTTDNHFVNAITAARHRTGEAGSDDAREAENDDESGAGKQA